MSAIDWAKFCAGMQWGDVRVDSEGRVTETPVAHVMSHPEGQEDRPRLQISAEGRKNIARMAKNMRGDMDAMLYGPQGGVQHVSDAAWEATTLSGLSQAALEADMQDDGTVLRTVEEWQSLVDQLAAKTAECERLTEALDYSRHCNMCLDDEVRRLREGREDGKSCDGSHVVGETYSHCPVHPISASLVVLADTLDPRLGVQQPEGEPVQPMPYWRRSGV